MKRYGLWGDRTRDFLTYGGQILIHENPAELAFLVPSAQVREVPPSIPAEQTLPVRFHPAMDAVQWPLQRRDFVHG